MRGASSAGVLRPATSLDIRPGFAIGDCQVSLRVYSPAGVLVRTLKSGVEQAGFYRVAWDGSDENGKRIGEGIYYCRLEAGGFTATRKMVKAE